MRSLRIMACKDRDRLAFRRTAHTDRNGRYDVWRSTGTEGATRTDVRPRKIRVAGEDTPMDLDITILTVWGSQPAKDGNISNVVE